MTTPSAAATPSGATPSETTPSETTPSGGTGPGALGEGARGLRRSRRAVEHYTIGSLDAMYVLFALVCLADVWARSASWGGQEIAASVLLVALVPAAIVVTHRRLRPGRGGRGGSLALGALGLGASVAMAASKEPELLYSDGAGAYFVTLLPLLTMFAAASGQAPWRRMIPWCVVAASVVTGAFAIVGVAPVGLGVLAVYALGAALVGVVTGGFSYWLLDVVRRLDEARGATARLAVAEERLRFSRDLHDVYGRTLSAIAMKSELAAELAARGDERAVGQMREVHDLAQSSLSEVRGIVAGYREVSLDTEVAGAAAMLRSAGARLEVTGLTQAQAALGPRGREVLAWVVREAVTNVIRHSHAKLVRLSARGPDQAGGPVVVSIANDGVAPPEALAGVSSPGRPPGNGLRGALERAQAVGGTVETRADGDLFTLEVTLPAGD